MPSGKSEIFGIAFYAGDPSSVSTASFDVPKGTLVLDTTNGVLYKKILALGTNTAGYVAMTSNTETQTLTNKTLTSPTITSPTITTATQSGTIDSDTKVLAATATYTSNATPAALTGFSWTLVAGATYVFDMELATTMTTVGGLTVAFALTTATLTSIRYNTYASTAADNGTAVSTTGTTTTSGTEPFDSKAAAYTRVRVFGSMVVNAGGTFAWQASQETSAGGGDASAVLIGSFARMLRVA